jgi:hypothetical protein
LSAGVAGTLPVALAAYAAASLLHHAHNAEFLADYPGMPEWLSRGTVYAVWAGATALGVLGYVLVRLGRRVIGLSLIALYGAYGFGSLAHYWLAPPAAHGGAMNATIALEVAAAAWLVWAVAARSTAHEA